MFSFSLGIAIEGEEDLLLSERFVREDRLLLQEHLVTEELLGSFIVIEFRGSKFSGIKDLRLLFNSDIPFFPLLHLEKLVDHLGDGVHLLFWILLD